MRNTCSAVAAVFIVLVSLIFSFPEPVKPETVDILPLAEVSTSLSVEHLYDWHGPIKTVEIFLQEEKVEFTPIDVPLSDELQFYAYELCIRSDPHVPFEMVMAIIEHESNFNADAVGHNPNGTSDYGLMQINSCTLPLMEELFGIQTEDELLNSEINLQAGIYILSLHMDNFDGSWSSALMAYQCGAGGAKEKLASGVTDTTFSRDILLRMQKFEQRDQI